MSLLLVLAFIVLGAGVFMRTESKTSAQPEVEGVKTESSPTMPVPEPTVLPTATKAPTPTNRPIPTNTPVPKIPASNVDTSWQYPGSQKVNDQTFTSTDEPQKITDWYKNKINSLGYQVRSFVQTNANDKIENSLSAAKNNNETSIKITKKPGDATVKIKVVLDN